LGCEEDSFSDTDGGEELIRKSSKKTAREYALLLVSTRTYTEKALIQKIGSKKVYSDEDILDAVNYVKSFGYVNDKRLAENMIPKLAQRFYGRNKICRYLASKGIDGDVIDSLDFSEIDFVYYCKMLLDRYAGKPEEKVMRALLNAGYTYDEIRAAKRIKD
jgi:regulatory protein